MTFTTKFIHILIGLFFISINSYGQNVPQNGWWWNSSESGRGFAIERQGSSIFMAAFLYEDSGEPTWYASLLKESTNGSYSGDLLKYSGGKSLFGNYKPPSSQTVVATVNLNFPVATKGTLSIKSSSNVLQKIINLERFPISSPVGFNPSESYFQSGWWWNPNESGTGYFFEVQGDKVFTASFMYDTTGNPTWYTTYSSLSNDASLSGTIDQYKGGQSLYGVYKKPYVSNSSKISAQYDFKFPDYGSFTLTNGKSITISRFKFEEESLSETYFNTGIDVNIGLIPGEYPITRIPNVQGAHGSLVLPNGREGLILSGWQYQNTTTAPNIQSGVMLLEQAKSGLMLSAGVKYLPSDNTNGSQSIIIADFNSDGQQDIFLPAFNEGPKRGLNSTFYVSNSIGRFDKQVLNDNIVGHGANLKIIQGMPTVFTSTYQADFGPYDNSLVFQYNDGKMKPIGQLDHSYCVMSSVIADINNDGKLDVASASGGTCIYDFNSAFNANYITHYPVVNPIKIIEPYLSKTEKYKNYTSFWGQGITHTYRVWAEDFNHDGLIDLLSGESMWSMESSTFPSALQMNQNLGDFKFRDMTNILNPMKLETEEIDYTMQIRDIDGSGINSLLLSSKTNDISRNANYLILNDGTGRLHFALHDEFIDISNKIMTSLDWTTKDGITRTAVWMGPHAGMYWTGNSWQRMSLEKFGIPAFIPYATSSNCLNYVAHAADYHINIPLNFCPSKDFKKSITIANRNNSKRIRTFGGDDKIYDLGSNASASVDGGAGTDTLIYSDIYSNYEVIKNDSITTVVNKISGKIDTVRNIEILRFKDKEIVL